MSWFGIGIYRPKYDCNIGTLFRSAHMFGAKFVFTVGGKKYRRQPGDTSDATSHIPYLYFETLDDLQIALDGLPIICVEILEGAVPLHEYHHPPKGVYLLGNESAGIPEDFCREKITVHIETPHCLNVSVAGSIVMYDRFLKEK